MDTAIDLKYAMRVANGEVRAKSPMEEAQIVDTLFHQRLAALKSHGKVEGFTQWQIRDAMEDILRAQDHTDAFKTTIKTIGDKLSGKDDPDAGNSDFLARLAHWDKLSIKQRLAAAGTFTNYMGDLFNAQLPEGSSFQLTCRSFMTMGPKIDFDFSSGIISPSSMVTQLCRNPNDDAHYFMRLNKNSNAFNDPVKVMGALFHSGIEGFELYLGREKAIGHPVPASMEEDAERVAGLQKYHVFDYACTLGRDVTLPTRFSYEQANEMAGALSQLVCNKGRNMPPPSEPTLVQRIGNALGLTRH